MTEAIASCDARPVRKRSVLLALVCLTALVAAAGASAQSSGGSYGGSSSTGGFGGSDWGGGGGGSSSRSSGSSGGSSGGYEAHGSSGGSGRGGGGCSVESLRRLAWCASPLVPLFALTLVAWLIARRMRVRPTPPRGPVSLLDLHLAFSTRAGREVVRALEVVAQDAPHLPALLEGTLEVLAARAGDARFVASRTSAGAPAVGSGYARRELERWLAEAREAYDALGRPRDHTGLVLVRVIAAIHADPRLHWPRTAADLTEGLRRIVALRPQVSALEVLWTPREAGMGWSESTLESLPGGLRPLERPGR